MVRIMSDGGPLDRGFEEDGAEVDYYPPTGCDQGVAFLRSPVSSSPNSPRPVPPCGALSTGVGVDFGMGEPHRLAQ